MGTKRLLSTTTTVAVMQVAHSLSQKPGSCPPGDYLDIDVFKNSPQCTACTTLCTESRMPSSTIDMCCSDWWEKCPGGLLPKFAETVCYALTSTPSPATLVTTFSPTSPATVETKSSDEHNLIVMWDLAKICVIIVVIVIVIIIVVAVCKKMQCRNDSTQPRPDNVARVLLPLNVKGDETNDRIDVVTESNPTATGRTRNRADGSAEERQSLINNGHPANGHPGAETESNPMTTGPAAEITGPAAMTTGPAAEITGPAAMTTGPAAEITGPAAMTTGPAAEITGPAAMTTGPAAMTTGPAAMTTGPAAMTTGPAATATGPAATATGPAATTTGPRPDNGEGAAEELDPLLRDGHPADDHPGAETESENDTTGPRANDNEDDSEERQSHNSRVVQAEDPPVVIAQCSNDPAQGRPNELEADPQPGDDDGHQAEVRPVAVRPALDFNGT